jgi:SAM-dependent methyltransferase
MNAEDAALLELGRHLRRADYFFVTITPESHGRVNARVGAAEARTLRDVFGWNRPFRPETVGERIWSLLDQADAVAACAGLYISKIRFSTYDALIFLHSAYPTLAANSVFFGPDTYRFLAAVEHCLGERSRAARRVVDIGTGSGAGGILLARHLPGAEIVLADISDDALRYAGINAALNEAQQVILAHSDVLGSLDGQFDLVVANPPYLVDVKARLYRDGGGALGHDLALRILRESLVRLAPGGTLLLYTGSAIVDGEDVFRARAQQMLHQGGFAHSYVEIDPDVFGEELAGGAYGQADRIAAVTLTVAA